jgi:hypothetical protein
MVQISDTRKKDSPPFGAWVLFLCPKNPISKKSAVNLQPLGWRWHFADFYDIKELIGHAHRKTTLIYTQISNKDISKIKSPLDDHIF